MFKWNKNKGPSKPSNVTEEQEEWRTKTSDDEEAYANEVESFDDEEEFMNDIDNFDEIDIDEDNINEIKND